MKKGFGIKLRPYTKIVGRWNKNEYMIVRELGTGMVGSVYLCDANGRQVALKISKQPLSMTKEVNVLQSLNKAQDKRLGPYLFDVDDWQISKHESYSFYVMEYINGESFTTFMRRQGPEWLGVMLVQLLDQLDKLHKAGWVFGDLKVENLIVEQASKQVRFIDVGGTTKIGRSIKEYSEFYDRGYWELGSRRAEQSYDLFAVVMVFLTIYYPNHFAKHSNSLQLIDHKIRKINDLRQFQRPFKKAIRNQYTTAAQMKKEVMRNFINYGQQENKKNKGWTELFLMIIMINLFFLGTIWLF